MNEQLPKEENFEPCYCWRCDGKVPAPCPHGTGTRTSKKQLRELYSRPSDLHGKVPECTSDHIACVRVYDADEVDALLRAAYEPRVRRSDDHLHLDEESGAVSVDHAVLAKAAREPFPRAPAASTPYMLDGTRFKLTFNNRGGTNSFAGYHAELHGRWVALVDATDNKHMRAAQPPGLLQIAEQIRNTARVSEDSDQMLVPRELLGQLAAVLRATSTKGGDHGQA